MSTCDPLPWEAPEPEAPAPAAPPVPTWKPFPVAELPEPMRGFVEAVAGATNTDASYPGIAAMVTAAACIGNRAAAVVKRGWSEPAVLWGVLVGKSGTMKTPALKPVVKSLVDIFKVERARYEAAAREYEIEHQRYEARLAEWKHQQRKGPATDPPMPPEAPVASRVLVSDTTIEKLAVLLNENPMGLLMMRPELAAWVGAFDRYANGGKGADCPAWLAMYDADHVLVDRKGDNGKTVFVERAAVSVLGAIQPGTLTRMFGSAEREAGLLARIIMAWPPTRPAIWTDAELSEDVQARWRGLLEDLLALEPGIDDDGHPRPHFIGLTPHAKRAFIGWHDTHGRELADLDGDDLAAHYSKLKGVCIRLGLVFACIRAVTGGAAVAGIDADDIGRAIQITEWLKHEAQRLYSTFAETDEERDRRRLVELVQRKGGTMTVRDLMRCCGGYGTSEEAELALHELVNAGVGQWALPSPGLRGGRPRKTFILGPVDTVDIDNTPPEGGGNGGFVNVSNVNAPENASDDDGDWGEI